MPKLIDAKVAEPPAGLFRCIPESLKERSLGVRYAFNRSWRWNIQTSPSSWISRRSTNRILVQKEPRFRHSDRDYANRGRIDPGLPHCRLDFGPSILRALPLGIPVNEQNITRVVFYSEAYTIHKILWLVLLEPHIRPLGSR